jgi:hypothetical protein
VLGTAFFYYMMMNQQQVVGHEHERREQDMGSFTIHLPQQVAQQLRALHGSRRLLEVEGGGMGRWGWGGEGEGGRVREGG